MSKNRESLIGFRPFRRAVLRGLGVILPPLLTIVFLLWIGNSVRRYILEPVEWTARRAMVWKFADIHESVPPKIQVDSAGNFAHDGKPFVQLETGEAVPRNVYETVRNDPGEQFPATALGIYDRYAEVEWLKPIYFVPVVLCLVILAVYLLGKFIAARIGSVIWAQFEQIINQVPIINTVYGTVKQVTDILFGDSEVEYTRVVAVEYPRRGIWSVGFVTGESMLALQGAAAEPVISVLMPTSPMPATGFTITVRKSETVELDLSVDQAFQFVVSCGVVVPKVGAGSDEVRGTIEATVSNQDGGQPPSVAQTPSGS